MTPASAPWDSGVRRSSRSPRRGPTEASDWPGALAPEAFHGALGHFVRLIEPHTEADPAAVLVQALVAFGNLIGHGPHFEAEADRHSLNLFAVLVGATAKGRKGTSWSHVRRLMEEIDQPWASTRVQSGLSSGEGLLHAVRDPLEEDDGVADKRLLVTESEFASTLRVMSRQGNTLSALIRQAWDSGNLRVLTKHSPAVASGAHIGIIGHITRDELRRELSRTECGNGFANRFLWVCARRSKCLPEGGSLDPHALHTVIDEIHLAAGHGRQVGRMARDQAAAKRWRDEYARLSEGYPGLLGSVTSRGEAQVMRMAGLFAISDGLSDIRADHLEASLAVWRYCVDSARHIFGAETGDAVADDILRALRKSAGGLTKTEIHAALGRNRSAAEISGALSALQEYGLAFPTGEHSDTAGRPFERWRATN